MNELETNLDIIIRSVVDEKSAKKAPQEITKIVLSALKDGYIEIPTALSADFDKSKVSSKLIKAQEDFIEQWKKMSAEGFSSSEKDLDDFMKKFNTFKRLLGKEAPDSKQDTALKSLNLTNISKLYKNGIKRIKTKSEELANAQAVQIDKDIKNYSKQMKKKRAAEKKAKQKYAKVGTGTITDEELASDLAKDRERHKYDGLGNIVPRDSGNKGIDPSRTNSHELRMSELSSYRSGLGRYMRLSEMSMRELAKKSLTSETYGSRKALDRAVAEKHETDKIQGRNKNLRYGAEEAKKLSADIRQNVLPEILRKMQNEENDDELDRLSKKFFDTLETISHLNQKTGTTIFSQVLKDVDKVMKSVGFSVGGNIGGTEGKDKTAKSRNPQIESLLKGFLQKIEEKEDAIKAELIKLEELQGGTKSKRKASSEKDTFANRLIAETRAANQAQVKNTKNITGVIETQTSYDKIEHTAERISDRAAATSDKDLISKTQEDLSSGFNTEANAQRLIDAVNQEDIKPNPALIKLANDLSKLMNPCEEALKSILSEIQGIAKNGIKTKNSKSKDQKDEIVEEFGKNLPDIMRGKAGEPLNQPIRSHYIDDEIKEKSRYAAAIAQAQISKQNEEIDDAIVEHAKQLEAQTKAQFPRSQISTTVKDPSSWFTKLKDVFAELTNTTANYKTIMAATSEEQDRMNAERAERYGLNRGSQPTDTGDKIGFARAKSLWKGTDRFKDLFGDIDFSEGIQIDTTAISDRIAKVLSGKEMFKAQTGGWMKNIFGAATGGLAFAFQPSLEKTRAQADAVNTIMANMREVMNKILQDILDKESKLSGMTESQGLRYTSEGAVDFENSTGEAKTLLLQLEESKLALQQILADVGMVDEVTAKTHGRLGSMLKQLGFTSTALRKNNAILANVNAGLDKNGKALKYQTRIQEVLNYGFQLMSRHIGQMIKNWLLMLNPINWIKKAFQDFASYDMKWQRTMNVIKYNLRRIIKPMMEWIAQQIVNIIGLVNALIKGIGVAFGQNWDLFDQSAASAEQMREELEQAANVTAGFDELHEIGSESSNNAAMDLLGDIYKPEWDDLYKSVEEFGKKIGDVIQGIQNLTEGWDFWKWLTIAGAALLGLTALKWLIGLFSGKNPLKTIADGFSFLEKAVGWALLIWAFTEFTKALTDFVECMKTASWEDIAKSLIMLGGAFALLFAGIAGAQGITKFLGTTTGELFGMSALVGVFALFVKALVPFIECIKDLGEDKIEVIAASLMTLSAAFIALIGGVAGVEGITKLVGLMGSELAGLAAVVGALDLFVAAITPFLKAINEIEGDKWDTIISMIGGLVGAFIALAAGLAIVSKAFIAMDWKAIGQLYLVAGVFEVFMFTLIPFVNAIKDVPFDTLAGGALLIAGAFLALGGGIALLAPALKMLDWGSLLQGVILLTAMVGIVWVLGEFVNQLKELSSEQIIAGLALLAGSLGVITLAIIALAATFTGLVTTGIGAAAIGLLDLTLVCVAAVILAIKELVIALGEAGEGIEKILNGIANVIDSTLKPILTFIDDIIGRICSLAETIVHEIGETIRTVIETVGEIIIKIIESITNAVPNLLNAILKFVREIGPAIETSANAIMRTIAKVINFTISAVEYLVNLIISGVNGIIRAINSVSQYVGINIPEVQKVEIPRFVPKYEKGTNYVPSDGLAYLHQGEAVVPAKYNKPYTPESNPNLENAIYALTKQVAQISDKVEQGIPVKGQFVQRGSDLVAAVERANNQLSNNILNNKVYAR